MAHKEEHFHTEEEAFRVATFMGGTHYREDRKTNPWTAKYEVPAAVKVKEPEPEPVYDPPIPAKDEPFQKSKAKARDTD